MLDMIFNKRLLDAILITGVHPTSALELFHDEINRSAPKMTGLSFSGMSTTYG